LYCISGVIFTLQSPDFFIILFDCQMPLVLMLGFLGLVFVTASFLLAKPSFCELKALYYKSIVDSLYSIFWVENTRFFQTWKSKTPFLKLFLS